jgi:hypothetical protein
MSSVFEKIFKYFLLRNKVRKQQNRGKQSDKSDGISPERQGLGFMVFSYFLGLFGADFWLF